MDTEPSDTQPIKETVTLDVTTVETTQDTTVEPLMADRHETLLQMQKMDPFCKYIAKLLLNGKGMNKDIWKYIANCTLCHGEKAKVQ